MSITGQLLQLHEQLYKRTDGRVGHRMIGVPTLLLRTTGRRSGATRTNGLVYARDGDDYLVVASNGGADRPPAWLHNLGANPDVEIQIARERRNSAARIVESSNPDYDRLWRIVNDSNHNRYGLATLGLGRPEDVPYPAVPLASAIPDANTTGPDRSEDRAVDAQAPAAEDLDEKDDRQDTEAGRGIQVWGERVAYVEHPDGNPVHIRGPAAGSTSRPSWRCLGLRVMAARPRSAAGGGSEPAQDRARA